MTWRVSPSSAAKERKLGPNFQKTGSMEMPGTTQTRIKADL